MKKNRQKVKGNGATTTAKDWGFGPVAGKGGSTRNSSIEGGQRGSKEGGTLLNQRNGVYSREDE